MLFPKVLQKTGYCPKFDREESEYLNEIEYNYLKNDCEELRKMLSSTTKTLSSTLKSQISKLTKEGDTTE